MNLSHDDETIIAQCTPRGNGALALLRVSGITAIEIITTMSKLASNNKLTTLPSHTIHYGWIINQNGTHIDQVMISLMKAPKTFTGQDTVEIMCHNNPFIINQIIQVAIHYGARLATAGEFTKRAVLNNKIDLVQAESINELIHAQTQISLKQALAQVEGSLSEWIITIEKALLKALTYSNASFEFIEEDISFEQQIKETIEEIKQTITQIKKTFNQQQQIRQGIRIAIVGSVNAGKSSLFNAILNNERAIVTSSAGTTRDAIEAGIYKNGNYWTLIDTAGLRQTNNSIEQEGIRRSHLESQKADIILLVVDSSRKMTTEEKKTYKNLINTYQEKIIIINNKCDLQSISNTLPSNIESLPFSNTEKTYVHKLEHGIEKKIAHLFSTIASPFLLNQRQFNLILNVEKKIDTILGMLSESIHYELIAHHLKDALEHIAELSGQSITQQSFDLVFRNFCIGK